jgi:hypothetical protein
MPTEAKKKDSFGNVITLGNEALVRLATSISPKRVLCIQGETAVGKSEITGQIARNLRSDFYKSPANCTAFCEAWNELTRGTSPIKSWTYEDGLPLVMRRLSQIQEGDLLGIPGDGFDGATRFKLTDWIAFVCRFPCVLFLDERNRGNDALKQATFEMQDSHAFHGMVFHPETRLMLAENVGDQYNVQSLDPAEMSRALMVNFKPTVKEWCAWARANGIDEAVVEYIELKEQFAYGQGTLEFPGQRDPGKKYPDRRNWTNLGREAASLDLFNHPEDVLLYHLAASMLGPEVATGFWEFCKTRERSVSAKEIVTDWGKAKRKSENSEGEIIQSRWLAMSSLLADYLRANVITTEQAKQIGLFVTDAPPEVKMVVWTTANGNHKNLHVLLPFIQDLMLKIATAQKVPTPTATPGTSTPTVSPRKR